MTKRSRGILNAWRFWFNVWLLCLRHNCLGWVVCVVHPLTRR
ncbi:DUF3265 domain-containing protein [Vibrio parahaemolyticus]|nr:DUF3265 domain-containing protein [Vibrio parahaemolyticus]TBT37250.1 DUF3265 domain-containing protein [Vibrio parahaemolyticus]TOZ87112.1 DUF3265 domain-containing protein [Vibrio parahaemolyticus]